MLRHLHPEQGEDGQQEVVGQPGVRGRLEWDVGEAGGRGGGRVPRTEVGGEYDQLGDGLPNLRTASRNIAVARCDTVQARTWGTPAGTR